MGRRECAKGVCAWGEVCMGRSVCVHGEECAKGVCVCMCVHGEECAKEGGVSENRCVWWLRIGICMCLTRRAELAQLVELIGW